MNPFDLSGKTILVTGASSGIGRQTAISLALMGAAVVITGRNEDRLKETFGQLGDAGHSYVVADLSGESGIDALAVAAPQLNGMAYCAGTVEYHPLKFLKRDKLETLFHINSFAPTLLTGKLARAKKLERGASLVFISSIASESGVPGTLAYASSKAALNTAVRVIASELSSQGIRANVICPGIVQTPMNAAADRATDLAETAKRYPLGPGQPEDVANAVIFHLSDASRRLTGNIMILDGGHTLI
jgi:NAD(P)-dependent dehydrogenase (short-subunit alcohol dehydrogenase family)